MQLAVTGEALLWYLTHGSPSAQWRLVYVLAQIITVSSSTRTPQLPGHAPTLILKFDILITAAYKC